MFCHVAQRKYSDFSIAVESAAIERRTPYMGALELTYRCNQACRHCYCNLGVNDNKKNDELSTPEIKKILDEAADLGCFWLILTGGEVLIREDFWDIYIHALRKGILIEVFTNGTLIDDEAAARFADYPPLGIDISIYAANAELHDNITRVNGSFKKTMDGIERLRAHKVQYSLKSILMTLNYSCLKDMQAFAKNLGAQFRFDTIICPRSDGGLAPAEYRLSAETMAELDLAEDFEAYKKIFEGFWGKKPDEALTCGAGVFAFNINPYGVFSPCTTFLSFQHSIREKSFVEAWKKVTEEHDKRKNEFTPDECRSCSMILMCYNCPAWAELETKSWKKKIEYVCEYVKCLEKKYFEKIKEAEDGKEAIQET